MREFLPTVNDIIHPEVLKLYPGASVPRFVLWDAGDHLELDYLSVRNMHPRRGIGVGGSRPLR